MARRCKQCRSVELKPAAKCTDIVEKKGFCSIECLLANTREKNTAAKAKQEKQKHLARKKSLTESSIRDQKPLAQKEFNRYIRLYRYHINGDRNCISCDRHESEIQDNGLGGRFDCGHFQGVGAFPELRFCEDNAYLQCKSCNGGSGKYASKNQTVGVEYERRLHEKVGDDLVDWLKGPHEPARLRAGDYVEVKKKYAALANEIQKNLA